MRPANEAQQTENAEQRSPPSPELHIRHQHARARLPASPIRSPYRTARTNRGSRLMRLL